MPEILLKTKKTCEGCGRDISTEKGYLFYQFEGTGEECFDVWPMQWNCETCFLAGDDDMN